MHWNIHLSSSGLNIYKDASDVFFMLNDSSPNPFQTPLSLSLSLSHTTSFHSRGICGCVSVICGCSSLFLRVEYL